MRPPSDVSWFRFTPVTSSLFAYHNHSEIGVMFTNLANYGALTYSTCTELEQFEHPIWVALICANLGQLKGICLYPMSNERMELVRFGTNLYWLVVWNMFFFHFIYGMSSFPLTNSYFSRWLLHHQAVWEQPKNAFNATGKISFSKNLDLGESIPITSCNQLKLVGGLEHLDYFSHSVGNVIIPTHEVIFSEG